MNNANLHNNLPNPSPTHSPHTRKRVRMNKRQYKKWRKRVYLKKLRERACRKASIETRKILIDMMLYGKGYHMNGRHVPRDSVDKHSDVLDCISYAFSGIPLGFSPMPDIKTLSRIQE